MGSIRYLFCSEWGELLELYERGDEVVFGNAIKKNMVRAKVHLHSCVWSLSASLGARDGRNPD